MTSRRAFLASLVAASTVPTLTWADAGDPAWLAAAKEPDGGFALFGMTAEGDERFRIPLPHRGHAGAAHPTRPEAVAFARRPGTFAIVLDCVTGSVLHRLDAAEGRHFYGHGCFSGDGDTLFTTENDIATGAGRVGIWARSEGYRRIGEVASGGIGPHEILRLPGAETLVVANGGILTHPDRGSEYLNIDTMRPSLTYLAPAGGIIENVFLDPVLRLNSIRHLSARRDGLVAFAMQWQGDLDEAPPLLGLHRQGGPVTLASAPGPEQVILEGYAGSVAFDRAGERVAITSPRGGRVHVYGSDGAFRTAHPRADVCGIGAAGPGFVATDGAGAVMLLDEEILGRTAFARAWDNHVVVV